MTLIAKITDGAAESWRVDVKKEFPNHSFPLLIEQSCLPDGYVFYTPAARPAVTVLQAAHEIAPRQIAGIWTQQWSVTTLDGEAALAALAAHGAYLLAQINSECEAALSQLQSGYPAGEVQSWERQLSEARAFVASASASTPMLDALAVARGITKADLASRVLAKADAFAAYSGALIGKRQALEDAIAAILADEEAAAANRLDRLSAVSW